MARGIAEITMSSVRAGGTRPTARLLPVHLAASAQVRLRRLVPDATFREDLAQLLVPLPAKERAADVLRDLIEDLLPAPSEGAATP